eukprot:1242836-Pyramimonas_sp.AAC.1
MSSERLYQWQWSMFVSFVKRLGQGPEESPWKSAGPHLGGQILTTNRGSIRDHAPPPTSQWPNTSSVY